MSDIVDPVALLSAAGGGIGSLDELAGLLLRGDETDPQNVRLRLGIVTASSTSGWSVSVRVSGSPSAVGGVPCAGAGALPLVGSTVVLLQTAGSYVCLGALNGSNAPAVGNVVVTTDGFASAFIPYGKTFTTTDIVILANGGNDENVYVLPGQQTTTGFFARFRQSANGAFIANGGVRCYFIAQPRNV